MTGSEAPALCGLILECFPDAQTVPESKHTDLSHIGPAISATLHPPELRPGGSATNPCLHAGFQRRSSKPREAVQVPRVHTAPKP